ncbi:hypothetical protein GGE46_003855 [Rhizobium etli]|uniref:Uncharacterized protein n=1 Tax=Rhizobium etli TaxID=29449 RepID=A0A7W6ZJ64_RHIET|nr:hypothetical protein [Rhizobium etli]MBB4537128.1 hypothetical protein [Rhizobium etli]
MSFVIVGTQLGGVFAAASVLLEINRSELVIIESEDVIWLLKDSPPNFSIQNERAFIAQE